jgi:hypothetical protein
MRDIRRNWDAFVSVNTQRPPAILRIASVFLVAQTPDTLFSARMRISGDRRARATAKRQRAHPLAF